MVKKITIGVIGIQGAVSEHVATMKKALKDTNISGKVSIIKKKEDIKKSDAIILPGGESSTISKVLTDSGLHDELLNRIKNDNIPILGTCAGCVILGSELSDPSEDVKTLSVMDMRVKRNAFGRQRESFEQDININGFAEPYPAVFIRAPIIEKVWGNCEILAEIEKKIVMARQENLLALSFHPELANDFRIHKYFLDII
jgi:5'-phosphate synthase pdxT subunit